MRLRSLLFVPGDRPDRMEKALEFGADALILDIEDSVALSKKAAARAATASFLRTAVRRAKLLVRINPLATELADHDLSEILDAKPDGIVLPKAEGAESVRVLARKAGGVPILPIATETAAGIFQLGTFAEVRQLLLGLTWGAEDLSAAMSALSVRNEDGSFAPPYELARSLTLFAGHAADVPVIDTIFPDLNDSVGLARQAHRAFRDGFSGMMAIHPSQVPVIHGSFRPTHDELRSAEDIVSAFQANPGAGALRVAGRMVDLPHLKRAQRLITLARDADEELMPSKS